MCYNGYCSIASSKKMVIHSPSLLKAYLYMRIGPCTFLQVDRFSVSLCLFLLLYLFHRLSAGDRVLSLDCVVFSLLGRMPRPIQEMFGCTCMTNITRLCLYYFELCANLNCLGKFFVGLFPRWEPLGPRMGHTIHAPRIPILFSRIKMLY